MLHPDIEAIYLDSPQKDLFPESLRKVFENQTVFISTSMFGVDSEELGFFTDIGVSINANTLLSLQDLPLETIINLWKVTFEDRWVTVSELFKQVEAQPEWLYFLVRLISNKKLETPLIDTLIHVMPDIQRQTRGFSPKRFRLVR